MCGRDLVYSRWATEGTRATKLVKGLVDRLLAREPHPLRSTRQRHIGDVCDAITALPTDPFLIKWYLSKSHAPMATMSGEEIPRHLPAAAAAMGNLAMLKDLRSKAVTAKEFLTVNEHLFSGALDAAVVNDQTEFVT